MPVNFDFKQAAGNFFSHFFPCDHIPFNHNYVIYQLNPSKHQTLYNFAIEFGGLCELICNQILIEDLLGNGKYTDYLKNRVTVESLDKEKIKESHILKVYSIFHKIIAYLFSLYPKNIFSWQEQLKLINHKTSKEGVSQKEVNREQLKEGLKKIAEGESLKLAVFTKAFCVFFGHSLLIKKTKDEKYIFFDPNSGEYRNLTFSQLCEKIDEQLALQSGTDIYLTKASDYLMKIKA